MNAVAEAGEQQSQVAPAVVCCNPKKSLPLKKHIIDPIDVSANCSYVKQGGQVIAYCRPPEDPFYIKHLSTTLSFLLSLFAIGLSIKSFNYTRSKDSRARRQSIQDEFWLRKVVSPVSIEPFLEFMQDTNRTLPTPSDTLLSIQAYYTEQVHKLTSVRMSFDALDLIDSALCDSVYNAITVYEDCLNDYLGNLQDFVNKTSQIAPNKSATEANLTRSALDVLKLIQEHQYRVGETIQ